MSIGEALTRARHEAGLSVADVSRRTRIRETIIGGIERDDFSPCGGDFYARGHIRAIARVVGIDPEPLIEEYDATYLQPDTIPGVHRPPDTAPGALGTTPGTRRPVETIPGYEAYEPVTPQEPVTRREPAALDEPARPAMPHTPVTPGAPFTRGRRGVTQVPPGMPVIPDEPTAAGEPVTAGAPVTHPRRRVNWSLVLGIALLVVVGFGAYLLASGGRTQHQTSAASNHRATGHPSARPTPTPAATSAAPMQVLNPVNIAAFGPGGAGQGDNPQLASFALDDNAASPWHSDWYSTPQFGNLEPGTGLLLDMGRTVTVTAAQIAVGNATGGDLQLRVGNTPALTGLPPVAGSTGVGGTVRLHLTARSQGRYVLVWFTKLPQDQAGTFQASVYSIKLQGSA